MKAFDYILFSLTVGFFVIGVHQSFVYGIAQSYWVFMVSVGFLLWYNIRKPERRTQDADSERVSPKKKSQKTKRKKH